MFLKIKLVILFVLLFSVISRASYGGNLVNSQLYPQTCRINSEHADFSPWKRMGFIFIVERKSLRVLMNFTMVTANWNPKFFEQRKIDIPSFVPLYLQLKNDDLTSSDSAVVGELSNLSDPTEIQFLVGRTNLHFISGSHILEMEVEVSGETYELIWECTKNNPFSEFVGIH